MSMSFLGLNDVGEIFISLNSLEKSGFGKKFKKPSYAVSRYAVTRYAVTGFTNNLLKT